MKKTTYIIIILIIFSVLFYITNYRSEKASAKKYLGDNIKLITYQNGNGALMIDYLEDNEDRLPLSLYIDQNNNKIFEEEELVLDNMMVLAKASKKNKVYFSAPENFSNNQFVKIVLDQETKELNLDLISRDFSDLMDLSSITNPEEAMKGLADIARVEGEIVEITQDNVPDINQKKGECAPTAAANGLISLINQHGTDENKNIDPEKLIEDLKKDMNWNIENGVQPDNFVEGKNLWAARNGLPIRTEKVGDTHGIETLEEIKKALEDGASVELRIKFADADLKSAGGHMVTVTGIHQGEGQNYIDINDPYTPSEEGTETVEIRNNQITNYGPWQGITVLSWGFVEKWETPLNRGTSLEPMSDTEVEGLIGEFGDREAKMTLETSFSHVKPGEYSEVYATIFAKPGTEVTLSLDGPSVSGPKRQIRETNADGQAQFTWKITNYGSYTVSGEGFNEVLVVN